jgi:flagellar protein FlaG
MAGNLTSVTGAPARTPAAPAPLADTGVVSARVAMPSGNEALPGGGNLPVIEPAELAVDVERAVARLNELMSKSQRSLRFQVDEISGRTVITVLDEETKQVVRQIPPPEWLEVVRRLAEAGHLLDTRS